MAESGALGASKSNDGITGVYKDMNRFIQKRARTNQLKRDSDISHIAKDVREINALRVSLSIYDEKIDAQKRRNK